MTTPTLIAPADLDALDRLARAADSTKALADAERASVMGRIGRSTELQRLDAEARDAAKALADFCTSSRVAQLVVAARSSVVMTADDVEILDVAEQSARQAGATREADALLSLLTRARAR